jgi:Bacterial PH domain
VDNAPAGRGKRGDADGGPQTFRSTTAAMVWWVWLLFLVANLIDIAVQGRDHASAVAAAILVLATGFFYVGAQRPRVIVDDAGVTVRNPLRDYRIGWTGITKADLADLLRIHCAWDSQQDGKRHTKIVSAWAVHYSRRRKLVAENRSRRAAQPRSFRVMSRGSLGSPPPDPSSAAELEAEKVVRLISERAAAAQAESVWAAGTVPIGGARTINPAKPAKPAKAPKAARAVDGLGSPGSAPTGSRTAANSAAGPDAATATAADRDAATAATAADSATQARPSAQTATATDAIADADLAASPGLAGSGWLEPLRSTWNTTALAALLIPALIVLIVALL